MQQGIAVLVVFVVGGAVGLFVGRGFAPEVEVAPPAIERPETTFSEEDDSEETAKPVPAMARVGAEEGESLLTRAIGEIEVRFDGVGTRDGVITGRVLTTTGDPLEGVEITARPRQRPDREEAETLEEKVREFIRDEQWGTGLETKGATDSAGLYRLEGIGADVNYRLSGKLAGYRVRTTGRWREVTSGDEVDFKATPVAEFDLTIVRADGSEPKTARVSLRKGNSSSTHTWTPKERTVEAEPGMYDLTATVEDTEQGEVEDIELILGAGATAVTITLDPRGAIRGRTIFSEGEVEGYAVVYLMSAAMKADPTPEDLTGAPKQTRVSRGEEFRFTDLDPGGYWIGAARGYGHEGNLPTLQYVEVADALVEIDVDLPPLDTEGGILVYAYSPQGTLLADARVTFEISSPQFTNSGFGDSTRMQDGGVLLRADDNVENQLKQVPNSSLRLVANHSSYGQERVDLVSTEGGSYDIHFRDPARAVVSVSGYVGSELIGRVQVQLQPSANAAANQNMYFGGYNSNESKPNENGEVKLGPYSPGEYDLILSYQDTRRNRWASGELARQPVTLVSGENRLSIPLPPVYSVEILFPEEVDGGSIQLQVSGDGDQFGAGSRHEQFEGSSAIIEGLIEGEYTLRAWASGLKGNNGNMKIQVPTGGPVVFDPPPVNAIRVYVSDPEGPLAAAGFEDGNVVRKINGQPFEGEEQLALLGVFLQGAESVTIVVARGGREVEMVVDPRGLFDGNPGGRFEPTSE